MSGTVFSLLDVSVLTVTYGRRGRQALVKFGSSKGKQVDWLVKPSTRGDARKNAWIFYVADFGNGILNRT